MIFSFTLLNDGCGNTGAKKGIYLITSTGNLVYLVSLITNSNVCIDGSKVDKGGSLSRPRYHGDGDFLTSFIIF